MQIFQYNGSAIVAMAGENCVAIGSDLRFGVQMQTMATDHQKLMQVRRFPCTRAHVFTSACSSIHWGPPKISGCR